MYFTSFNLGTIGGVHFTLTIEEKCELCDCSSHFDIIDMSYVATCIYIVATHVHGAERAVWGPV